MPDCLGRNGDGNGGAATDFADYLGDAEPACGEPAGFDLCELGFRASVFGNLWL